MQSILCCITRLPNGTFKTYAVVFKTFLDHAWQTCYTVNSIFINTKIKNYLRY